MSYKAPTISFLRPWLQPEELHEGNATGKIPDKHFNRLLAKYDTEQSTLEQEVERKRE